LQEGEAEVVHQVVVEEEEEVHQEVEVEEEVEEVTILLDPVVEAEVQDHLAPFQSSLNSLAIRMSKASQLFAVLFSMIKDYIYHS
jgi:hypothetical protein